MYLSIIIPVLNEVEKISDDIIFLSDYLIHNNIKGEIIISDDGSTDGTLETANEISSTENIRLITLKENKHHGKGHAVRKGIIQSKGENILIIDSGKTITLDFINKGVDMIRKNKYKIILGSRHLPESIIHKQLVWYRRLASIIFRIYTKFLFPSIWRFSDTQCGFKIYDAIIARQLFGIAKIDGFLFEIEILRLAKEKDISMMEMPIEWTCDRDSRLSFIATIWEVFRDSWKLKFFS
tara:strand:+ start:18788 stop:19501 length:714 start_codon:yes stop_codon:yes gene_type:complete